MPHRIPNLATALSALCEGMVLAVLAVWQGALAIMEIITESDWAKLMGPHGVAFGAVICCGILWGTYLRSRSQERKDAEAREAREDKRREKEDEARERRHNEIVTTNSKNAEDLKKLTAESIKAQMLVAHEQRTHANNAQLLSINVHNLCEVLKKSPCLATMKLRDAQPEMPTDSRL